MDGVGGSGRKQGQEDLDPTQKSGRLERGLENGPMDVDQGQGANKKAEHHRAESPKQTDLNKRKAETVFSDSESSDDDMPLVHLKKKATGKRVASVAFSKDDESSDDDAPLYQGKANLPPQKKASRADGEHVIRIDSDSESSDDDMPLVQLKAPAKKRQSQVLDGLSDSDEESDDDVPLVRRSTKGKQPAIPDSSDEESDDDEPLVARASVQRVQENEKQKTPVPRKRKQAIEVRNQLLDTPEKRKIAGYARRTAAVHRRSRKHLTRTELEAFYRGTKTGKDNPDAFDIYYASYEDDLRTALEERTVRSNHNRQDQQRPEARAQELGAENGADRTFDGKRLPLRSEMEARFVRNNPGLLTGEKNETACKRIIDRYVSAFNRSYLAFQGDPIQEAEARGIIDGSQRARGNKFGRAPERGSLKLTFGRKYGALKSVDGALDAYLDGYDKGYKDQEKTPLERARIAGVRNGKAAGKRGRNMRPRSELRKTFEKKYPLLIEEGPELVETYLDTYEEQFNAARATNPIERAKAIATSYARGQVSQAGRLPGDAELSRNFKSKYKDLAKNPEAVLVYVSECRRIFEEKEKDPIVRAEIIGHHLGKVAADRGLVRMIEEEKMRLNFRKFHPELVDVTGAFDAYRRSYRLGFNSGVSGPAAQAALAGRTSGRRRALTRSELPSDDFLKRRFLSSRPHLAGNQAALAAFIDAYKESFASNQREPLERSAHIGISRADGQINKGVSEESDEALEAYFTEKYPELQEVDGALESYLNAYKSVFLAKSKTPVERVQFLAVAMARAKNASGRKCYSEDYLRDFFVERHSDLAEDEVNIRAYIDAYIGYYQEHEKTPIERSRALGHQRGLIQACTGHRLPLNSELKKSFARNHEELAGDNANIQAYIEALNAAYSFHRRTPMERARVLANKNAKNLALQGAPEPSAESIATLFEERYPSLAEDEEAMEAYVETYRNVYNKYKKPPEEQAALQGTIKGGMRAAQGYRLPLDEELKSKALEQFSSFEDNPESVEIFVNAYKEAFKLAEISPESRAKVLGIRSGKTQAKGQATLPSDKKIKARFKKGHPELAEDDALVAIYLRNYKESFKETLEYIEE